MNSHAEDDLGVPDKVLMKYIRYGHLFPPSRNVYQREWCGRESSTAVQHHHREEKGSEANTIGNGVEEKAVQQYSTTIEKRSEAKQSEQKKRKYECLQCIDG